MEGGVIRESDSSPDVVAMRAFNKMLLADQRVTISLIPIGDGLMLVRKR
jgi:predicted O-methyltransferase YrrM